MYYTIVHIICSTSTILYVGIQSEVKGGGGGRVVR